MNSFATEINWTALLFAALAFSSMALVQPAQAELRKVDQATFGMDCAPCAFGVERGLQGLEGVEDVAVSLNEAKSVVELGPQNEVTLREIRAIIRDGGFDPRQAYIEARGQLVSGQEGERLLVLESGERFELRPALATEDAGREANNQVWRQIQQFESGQRLAVSGVVPQPEAGDENESTAMALHVEQVEPVQANE